MGTMKPRVTSFAPQFLVDDLERSIAYYQKIGFTFREPWEGFTRSVFWTDLNFT
jgi:predicted lactoylglutathione lyase